MSNYIETAISLILIFFIFSVIAYVIQEIIAVNLQYRGKVLYKSLSNLFDDVKIKGRDFLAKKIGSISSSNTDVFYSHPQIASLRKNLDRLPAYIPAANFSLAIMDMIAKAADPAQAQAAQLDKIRSGLNAFIQ